MRKPHFGHYFPILLPLFLQKDSIQVLFTRSAKRFSSCAPVFCAVLLGVVLALGAANPAYAQLLEGRNKLKTAEEKPEKGFFLFRKKGKSTEGAGKVSRKERRVDIRTTKVKKSKVKQGGNYNSTGGGVSIDNSPRSRPRYSENKPVKKKAKVKTARKGNKFKRQASLNLPEIRLTPKLHIYNPASPNPRYSRKPGFDKKDRVASTPRYSAPSPTVKSHTVTPKYSESQGFALKKNKWTVGFRKTPGILPVAKAGPRYSKQRKIEPPESVSPKYSRDPGFVTKKSGWVVGFRKTPGVLPFAKQEPRYSKKRPIESPGTVMPRYSQEQGFVTRKRGWVVGFRKTPGIMPFARNTPRYSKDRGIEPPESVSPRYSREQGFVTGKPKWVFGFKKTPGMLPVARSGPRYSKERGIEPPESVSPRYSRDPGFVVKKSKWTVSFSDKSGILPLAKTGPRYSKSPGFYRPGRGVGRYSDPGAAQFLLPEKDKRRNNRYNPEVAYYGLVIGLKPWQKNSARNFNNIISSWKRDDARMWRIDERHQQEWAAAAHSQYTGNYKLKKRRGDMHPSIAYLSGKKISSRKLRKEWREMNIALARLNGNKEVAKGVKNGPEKPKYDKKERDIWNY